MAIVYRPDRGQARRRAIRRLLGVVLRELGKGLALTGTTCVCPVVAHAARDARSAAPEDQGSGDPDRAWAREEVAYLEALWRL